MRLHLIRVFHLIKKASRLHSPALSIGCSVRVPHSYTLQTFGIIRLITLFYMGSVNYDHIHQIGAYVIDNLSLDNFRQVDMNYTHLRSVPGSLNKKPAIWFEREKCIQEHDRVSKSSSTPLILVLVSCLQKFSSYTHSFNKVMVARIAKPEAF